MDDLLRIIGEQAVKIDLLERELASELGNSDTSSPLTDKPPIHEGVGNVWLESRVDALHPMSAEALTEIRDAAGD